MSKIQKTLTTMLENSYTFFHKNQQTSYVIPMRSNIFQCRYVSQQSFSDPGKISKRFEADKEWLVSKMLGCSIQNTVQPGMTIEDDDLLVKSTRLSQNSIQLYCLTVQSDAKLLYEANMETDHQHCSRERWIRSLRFLRPMGKYFIYEESIQKCATCNV